MSCGIIIMSLIEIHLDFNATQRQIMRARKTNKQTMKMKQSPLILRRRLCLWEQVGYWKSTQELHNGISTLTPREIAIRFILILLNNSQYLKVNQYRHSASQSVPLERPFQHNTVFFVEFMSNTILCTVHWSKTPVSISVENMERFSTCGCVDVSMLQ